MLSDKVSVNIKHIAERMTQVKIDHQHFLALCEAYPTLTSEEIDTANRAIATYVSEFQTLFTLLKTEGMSENENHS